MASTSSSGRRSKLVHAYPAHICAYGPCCNFTVPPAKGRKHRCCSEECLEALLVEIRDYSYCRTCKAGFKGTGSQVHCPACLATSRKAGQLPPHRCGYRNCCNFIVPPSTAKKHLFCSNECKRAQHNYDLTYSTCQTKGCGVQIKRNSYVTNCAECLAKKEQRRALARASERYPKKKCRWVFCQKEFQPGAATECYCSTECRKAGSRGHSGPGYPQKMPPADHVFCEGNCGATFREGSISPWGTPITYCLPCWLGHQNSSLRPFGTLPPGWHRCQWVFCNALYRAESPDQRACCVLHEKLRKARTPGRFNRFGRTHTWHYHKCANNCGTTLLYASQPVCLPCLLGQRYGRVNPFAEDAEERARWAEPVVNLTDKQLTAEWDYLWPPEPEAVASNEETDCKSPVVRVFSAYGQAPRNLASPRHPQFGPVLATIGCLVAGFAVGWWASR